MVTPALLSAPESACWYGWRCRRFPWLPRWWWLDPWRSSTGANPNYQGNYPHPDLDDYPYPSQPSASDELQSLKEEHQALSDELKAVSERIQELESQKTNKTKK